MSIRQLVPFILLLGCAVVRADGPSQKDENAPSPEKPQHVLIVGQAFNHIGAGVEDATVTLRLKDSETVLGTTHTNALGDFSIVADKNVTGSAVVTVTKQYHQEAALEVELGAPGGPPFVDVEMVGAIALQGTVKDARTDQPIAGAKIVLEAAYREWNAKSGVDGAFRIAGLFPGPAVLTVDAAGFARARSRVERVEDAGPQTLRLKPERLVNLYVDDESGKPLAGVDVECLEESAGDYRHLLTDTNGLAVLRGLTHEAAALKVRLRHDSYVSATDFDRTVALPADRVESTHHLVMQQAGIVIGKVIDAESRDPLLGARLSVGDFLDDRLPRAWSEFDGTYRVTGVPPGAVLVTVHLSGYAPQLARVSVTGGKETTHDFKLSAPRRVVGCVVDADGKPVPGVHVTATRWREAETLGLRALTDAAGRYEILDAPRDAFVVALYAPGFKPLLDQPIGVEETAYDFKLAVDERARTAGESSRLAVGTTAPPLAVTTLDGESLELEQLKDKVVLLDFWATWCGPCLGEIPYLVEVHEAFGKRPDFLLLSVSLDDDPARLRAFVTARKMAWRHVCGEANGVSRAAEAYGVMAIPALFLIDREGKVVATDLRGSGMVRRVEKALNPE